MDNFISFEEFLTQSRTSISIGWFVFNLLIATILSLGLGKIYTKYGTSLSNRELFGSNFLLITLSTMLIITIVKSSLALSLGLVGALSIIRFRAAIKEPEELTYLFLAIAIGLGLGANQGIVTVTALVFICIVIIIRKRINGQGYQGCNLHLTISKSQPGQIEIEKIVEVLKENCSEVHLKRLDENDKMFEASFMVEFSNFKILSRTKQILKELDSSLNFTFLDNKGIY